MAATRRLRDKMREDLELRRMSANTIDTYARCARRLAEHHGRSPCTMGASEIRAFLLSLVRAMPRSVRLRPARPRREPATVPATAAPTALRCARFPAGSRSRTSPRVCTFRA
jgi:hypothetical protein